MKLSVFDLHCDTALALLGDNLEEAGSLLHNNLHISLERAEAFSGYCQCFACFTTPSMAEQYGISPEEVFRRELASVERETAAHADRIALAASARQIEANRKAGLASAVLTIEGPAGFGFDPGRLEELYARGFRISTLGWNEKNVLTGSNQTGGGLTELGRAYVREAQRLGMLLDVSHLSDEGFWDLIRITRGPVVATHSNSRAVCPVPRNLTDEMFLAICETGGVAGINLYTEFLGPHADPDTVCDHIFHFLELDPEGTHIAMGGDLDGCDSIPAGMQGIDGYCLIGDRLQQRGLEEAVIHRIFWENALGVMKTCCT